MMNRFEREGVNEFGYKEGDMFRVLVSDTFGEGDIIELVDDDDSDCPKFVSRTTGHRGFEEYRLLEWIGHKDGAENMTQEATDDNLITIACVGNDMFEVTFNNKVKQCNGWGDALFTADIIHTFWRNN